MSSIEQTGIHEPPDDISEEKETMQKYVEQDIETFIRLWHGTKYTDNFQ